MPNPFIGVPVPIILLAILGAFTLLIAFLWTIAVIINLISVESLISKTGGRRIQKDGDSK